MSFLFLINKFVGLAHFGCALMKNIHIIIYPSTFFEKSIFVTLYAMTPISWILCKDECLVSYCIKKLNNPQYVLGDEPHNYKDMEDIFVNLQLYDALFHVNTLLQTVSLFIIKQKHENINSPIFYIALITKLIYIYDIKYNRNIRKILYPWFQIIMLSSFAGLLFQWYFVKN